MEETISSRRTAPSISWTHSTSPSDNLSDLENVSANWTYESFDPSSRSEGGSRRSPSPESCQQTPYGHEEVKRRGRFKARHIQMMAFGIAPILFLKLEAWL